MKKIYRILLLVILVLAIAGIIKFNASDAPFKGDPITYISMESGEIIEARFKTDDTVEVSLMEHENANLKAFKATRARSASGAKYQSKNKRFVYWTKGHEALIEIDGKITYNGIQTELKTYQGKLILGHESHTFQLCGTQNVTWISDPHDLLQDKYSALTQGLAPYTEVYTEVKGGIVPVGHNIEGFAADFDNIFVARELMTIDSLESHSGCS